MSILHRGCHRVVQLLAISANAFLQFGQPWVAVGWRSSIVVESKDLMQEEQPWVPPRTNNVEEESGWIQFK